jgi:hypothetical protein
VAGDQSNLDETPAASRSCGSCAMCCKIMAIDELAKPAGTWCVHRRGPTGCGIHGAHPPSCRAFSCQWLLEPDMPRRLRPDQTKVVLVYRDEGPGLVAFCDPSNPLAWRREPMFSLLKQQATATWDQPMIVIAQAGRRTWLITPTLEIDLGDVNAGLRVRKSADGSASVELVPVDGAQTR